MNQATLVDCPACDGAGEIVQCVNDGKAGCSHVNDYAYRCQDCNGEGAVPADEPLPFWKPTDSDGHWNHTTAAPKPRTDLTLLGTVVTCALLTVAFLLAQAGGRALMCATHKTTAGHGALTYCHDYQPTEPRR